jgi:hypothetical protein
MELKPCPFCGHTPIEDEKKTKNGTMHFIKCACSIHTGFYVNQGLLQRFWNTRK